VISTTLPDGSEYSSITTASAPSGRQAPVEMPTACPGRERTDGIAPIDTCPAMCSGVGSDSLAPNVSVARTAQPSIDARGKGG
jgi:hypothetical protein